jgi:hypothetical protein
MLGTLYKTRRCWVYNDTGEIILMHFSLILFRSIIYVKVLMYIMFLGTIAHYELCTTVEIIAVFLADIMPQIHDIMFCFLCFGQQLNRANSKNSVMTVIRIQQKCILIFRIVGF